MEKQFEIEKADEQLSSLDNAKTLNEFVESNPYRFPHPHTIASESARIQKIHLEKGEHEQAELAARISDVFSFWIQDGEVRPLKRFKHPVSGDEIVYPDLESFTPESLQELDRWFEETANPLLKARLGMILWNSKKKHLKYPETVVKSYLQLCKTYQDSHTGEKPYDFALDVSKCLLNALELSKNAKTKCDEVLSTALRIYKEFPLTGTGQPALRLGIITKIFLPNHKSFNPQQMEELKSVHTDVLGILGPYHQIDYLKAIGAIESRFEVSLLDWKARLSAVYENLMKEHESRNSHAAVDFCLYAKNLCEELGNVEKANTLNHKYRELQDSIRLKPIEQEFDISELAKPFKEVAEKITDQEPAMMLLSLRDDSGLIPDASTLRGQSEDFRKQFVLAGMTPYTVLDQRGNPVEHFITEEEKSRYWLLKQYDMDFQLVRSRLIHEIFVRAVNKGKLTVPSLRDFLQKFSWAGQQLTRRYGNEVFTICWTEQILPSVSVHLEEISKRDSDDSYRPNFLPSVDSLTLKCEGLLREFCQLLRIPTFFEKTDKNGKTIVNEKDINALLREDKLKQYFDENELLFFRYVLVEKAGLNMRHRVAHNLMLPQEYGFQDMSNLLLVILKLTKHNIVDSQDGATDKKSEPAKTME